MTTKDVRALIREEKITGPTVGMCAGYAQANLVVLPKELAYDFLLFTQRNPKSCPLLEVSDTGSRLLHEIADGADIATEIPRYRIYRDGALSGEYTDVSEFWQDDFVSFLIGCSFSFESALLEANIPVRHIEENCNVPMYKTNIPCTPAGVFHGNMVVQSRMSSSQKLFSSPAKCRACTAPRSTSELRRQSASQTFIIRISAIWSRSAKGKSLSSGRAA